MRQLFLAFFLLIVACTTSGKKYVKDEVNHTSDSGNILIVYLSRTNNTKAIAEIIQHNVGGTLVALELEKPYPSFFAWARKQRCDVLHDDVLGS